MKRIVPAGLVIYALIGGRAVAKGDTTPPVLLDFTISPVLFDTAIGDVTVASCVTAADDISGVGSVVVRADSPASSLHRSRQFASIIQTLPKGRSSSASSKSYAELRRNCPDYSHGCPATTCGDWPVRRSKCPGGSTM